MLEEFMTWLNAEIEKLEHVKDEDKMFILGKHSEAIRIRAQLCNMVAEENKQSSKPTEVMDMLNDMWKQRIEEREKHD